jgi:hypothetical protein
MILRACWARLSRSEMPENWCLLRCVSPVLAADLRVHRGMSATGKCRHQHWYPPHTPPHRPRHAACRTDIPWVVQNSSMKSFGYRNGTSPLATPTYGWIQLIYRDEGGGGLRRMGGSLLTTVAVQPGRCRRFIGTLLARIKYAPRTLRMVRRDTKQRRDESHAADVGKSNAILRQTISRSISRKKL